MGQADATRQGTGSYESPFSRQGGNVREAEQHSEGWLARTLEHETAKLPSDIWLWAAFGSIGASLLFQATGRKQEANFVGHWAPTFLLLGIYNKIVKVAGTDRVSR
jgi:hypothetical protein